jgi:ubiquitin-conjugating enzyme (huntingtin interacting protein 2)
MIIFGRIITLSCLYSTGAICHDTIKEEWSPVVTLRTMLIMLQSLLHSPVPENPQDEEVAMHFITNKSSFDETAAYWTHVYAGGLDRGKVIENGIGKDEEGSVGGIDEVVLAGLEKEHVDQFEELGFSRSKVVSGFLYVFYISCCTARLQVANSSE